MIFNTPKVVKQTNIDLSAVIQHLHNGLFRCPLDLAKSKMPELSDLFDSVPVKDQSHYEVDVKVHMLMAGQYPCIPNWHCDNVPRFDGQVSYEKSSTGIEPMLLWISGGPETEFLAETIDMPTPMSHGDLASWIRENSPATQKILGNHWYSMDQRTPHRGTMCKENTWRVFVRVTNKSQTPVRPVTDVIRKHSQVYLDSNFFTW